MSNGILFRGSRRARVNTYAMVVEPGHPGAASFSVIDLSDGGMFLADDASFPTEASLRVGLPSASGHGAVWASGTVVWRGRKEGLDGVGIRLAFEHDENESTWKRTVSDWLDQQSATTMQSLRQIASRGAGAL